MAGARAAIRYAKALLSLASDQKAADAVNTDMKLIANTIAESKELSEMLQSPVLPPSDKKAVLLEVFKKSNKTTKSLITSSKKGLRFLLFGRDKRKSLPEKHSVVLF
mgnify:CR=1 FL=1